MAPSIRIECEVTNTPRFDNCHQRRGRCSDVDNFDPVAPKDAIDTITRMGLRERTKIEISGGVRFSNIKSLCRSKPGQDICLRLSYTLG